MITHRLLQESDYDLLSASLTSDEYHATTEPSFFSEPGTACSVYEDDKGPVLFLKGTPYLVELYDAKVIKLDIQFVSNDAHLRNLRVMRHGFPELAKMAHGNGFDALFFYSSVPALRDFCIGRLGFIALGNDMLLKVLP